MRRRTTKSLRLEPLETRTLFAGLVNGEPSEMTLTRVSINNDGELAILGTAGKDKVTVREKTIDGKLQLLIVNEMPPGPNGGITNKETFQIDRSLVNAKRIFFDGGAGNDYFQYFSATVFPMRVFAYGGAGNDNLFGSGADDLLVGGAGDDWIHGMGGHDILMGGLGCDKLRGDEGDDLLYGGGDRDDLHGGAGRDVLDGGNDGWSDMLTGGPDDDCFRRELYVKDGQTRNRDYPVGPQPSDTFFDAAMANENFGIVKKVFAKNGIRVRNDDR